MTNGEKAEKARQLLEKYASTYEVLEDLKRQASEQLRVIMDELEVVYNELDERDKIEIADRLTKFLSKI